MNMNDHNRSCHIIMVDDDEDDIFIMRKELRKAGFSDNDFLALSGGPELLLFLKEREQQMDEELLPDLILLDINMPRMDGFEVLAQLKSDETVRDIPVIMFSTSSQKADLNRSFSLGAADYLVKPRELNEFREMIAKIKDFLRKNGKEPPSLGAQH